MRLRLDKNSLWTEKPLLDYDDVTIEVESEEQEMIQHPHPEDD